MKAFYYFDHHSITRWYTRKPGTEVRPQSLARMPKRISDDSIAFTLATLRTQTENCILSAFAMF